MDYEFRILALEKELTHAREMQAFHRGHLDAHDASFKAVGTRMERIEADLADAVATLKGVTVAQVVTEQKLQGLIDILAREHANGKPR